MQFGHRVPYEIVWGGSAKAASSSVSNKHSYRKSDTISRHNLAVKKLGKWKGNLKRMVTFICHSWKIGLYWRIVLVVNLICKLYRLSWKFGEVLILYGSSSSLEVFLQLQNNSRFCFRRDFCFSIKCKQFLFIDWGIIAQKEFVWNTYVTVISTSSC